ncbi:hypothetical protein [Cloacibacterium sp. TD35]|uniref:hypothetical protein n=1 Tax=Cloacibacterium sp. TD35 TaxID=2976818 RepID=UPI00237EB3B1|nr:hypothetical protein [Cloacibacterium sp. TD35]WDT67237.1 hypothetical protein N7277_07805 [Cloacibacterium sp. TD35]
MKKLIILFFSIFSLCSYSQEDFKKKIAQDACKCIGEIKPEKKSKEVMQMQLGLCFIKVATPYKEQIKKEYGIDLSKDISNEAKMEELGEKLGVLMVSECADTFISFVDKSGYGEQYAQETAEESSADFMNGEITRIEKDAFVIFYLKGDNGILTKFYWISNVDSNIELEKKYQDLVGKKVNISYYSADIFDHKINDYRKVNILSMLKTE